MMLNEIVKNENNINENKSYTLCLNMIVKNESKIITRLLESVCPLIDCYCICDTGSTDNTIELIENFFAEKKIPGKIVNEPFKNFCYNRTFALNAAKGMSDYVLLLDADMIIEFNTDIKSILGKTDSYSLLQGNESFYYKNVRIVKNDGLSKYLGVTHEYISLPNGYTSMSIPKNVLFIRDIGDGGSKSDKFDRDIRLLTEGIKDEPKNVRYYFYLANSYFDKGQYEKAIEFYKKRIEMKDWEQEVWYSYYKIGMAYKHLGNMSEAICTWMDGYEYLPDRLEGLYEIIHHYRNTSKYKLCYQFCNIAINILQQKKDIDGYLFLHKDVYSFLLLYEFTIIAFYVGIKNINNEAITILNNCTPKHNYVVNSLLRNMKFYNCKLLPIKTINMSNTVTIPINDQLTDLVSSSSCLIKNPNKNGYIMNMRYVNYNIRPDGSYVNCDNHIITANKYIELNEEFNIVYEKMCDVHFNFKRYIGIEDVRIFYETHKNKLVFIGTSLHERNRIGMLYGDYNLLRQSGISRELRSSFSDETCEKNWVYVDYKNETHIIYKWHPLQICKINHETSLIYTVETKNMPTIFSHVRGSSCGFAYKNEIWFIVHVVSYESPRHYYHMIVVFDDSMNLKHHTSLFKFANEPIEYSLSIIVEEDRVLIPYSTWDRTTHIGVYDKKNIITQNI